jgi:hypothetical protein
MTIQAPEQMGGPPPTDPNRPGVVDTAKDEAAVVVDRAKQETSRLVDEARRTIRSQSDQQAGRVASGARGLAQQLDDLASGRGSTDGQVADLARDAAARIGALADRLDADGIDGVTREVKQFARRRPGTYLGGAFALGIAAGRVFRNADTAALAQAARPGSDDGAMPSGTPTPTPTATHTQEDLSWPTPPQH